MNKTEQSRIAFDQQADTYDSDFHGKHAREPVSYTHLDVYKRQAQYQNKLCNRMSFRLLLISRS